MKKLKFEDYIPLDSIDAWGYIPEFKRHGPCGKVMVRVGDVINALNRHVKLTVREDFLGPLYVLLKEYNVMVEHTKDAALKAASSAELELENILYKEERKQEKIEQLENPLDDSSTEQEDLQIQKMINSRPTFQHKKQKKNSTPRVYEVVANKKINTYEELIPKSIRSTYDDIEFNLD